MSKTKIIKIHANDYLQLAQVVIKDMNGNNIANSGSVQADPPWNPANKQYPIDGTQSPRNFPNIYHSQNQGGNWTLTLNNSTQISSITIYNRSDCCGGRLGTANMQLIDDNGNITNTFQLKGDQIQTITINPIDNHLNNLNLPTYTTKITITNPNNLLQLAQVAVFDINGTNIAPNGTTNSSPSWDMGPNNDSKAGNAIDGQLMVKSYPYIYHSQDIGQYWTLKLQNPTPISNITIYNRDQNNCCSDRLNGAIMQLFDNSGKIMTTITLTGAQKQAYQFTTDLPFTKCNYQMSPTELTCYKNRYPDLSALDSSKLQSQWSATGCNEKRDNQCNNPIQTTSGLYNYKGCYNSITDNSGSVPNNNGLVKSVDQCQSIATNNRQNIFALNNSN